MISQAKVKDWLNAADGDFRWAWEIVSSLRTVSIGDSFGLSVVKFQPRLADAIAKLEGGYRLVKQEEKRLISRKSLYDYRWFSQRMKKLNLYTKLIGDALAIGRALGDAFAWFFYERNPTLIDEHLKQQRQPLLPPTIGRLGERLALQHMQGVGGNIFIYHGTTTFLRLGDFSLIDLKTLKVAAIGEIKTEKISDTEYRLFASFIGDNPINLPSTTSATTTGSLKRELSPVIRQRLDRQMKQLDEAISRSKEAQKQNSSGLRGNLYSDELDAIIEKSHSRKFQFTKVGNGLVIGALRFKSRPLGDAIMSHLSNIDSKIDNAQEWALQILDPTMQGNAIILDSLGGDKDDLIVSRDTLPFLWWPVKEETLRQILFREVIVFTLYNPAHLYASLQTRGFTLHWNSNGRFQKAVRDRGRLRQEFQHLSFFHRLICQNLITESCVLDMLDQMLGEIDEQVTGPAYIDLRPRIVRHADPFLPTARDAGGDKAAELAAAD